MSDQKTKIWLGISVLLAVMISAVFFIFADLRPKISPEFFFGSDDPQLADTQKIADLFPGDEFLILQVSGAKVRSTAYLTALDQLTQKLQALPEFVKLLSLTEGPENPQDAMKSPFWQPLLVGADGQSTLIIAFLSRGASDQLVPAAEQIALEAQKGSAITGIHLSGMPYITYKIQQNIVQDAQIFSTVSLVLFGVLIWLLFRSVVIAVAASLSGIIAVFMTLTELYVLGQPVGILTANLAIIVFVLVQSQIIYLSNNWRREEQAGGFMAIRHAVLKTLQPALWCAVTTLLGFVSLLFVSAEPLAQLGVGGVVGVISAFLCCFVIFPPFLALVQKSNRNRLHDDSRLKPKTGLRLSLGVGIVVLAAVSLPGIFKLETDPSLFSYFKEGGEIEQGLSIIDRNGGSSPLQLVVRQKTGEKLDNGPAYERLWAFHKDLDKYPDVGAVLSLPALLAEANNHPLAFLIPWREMVTLLRLESNQKVVDNFLSEDRRLGLFTLRMKENGRSQSRAEIINDIKELADRQGLNAELVGGVYALQGHLAKLVKQSLSEGLTALLVIFFAIAFFLTRQWVLAISMLVCAALIPIISLGGSGWVGASLDVISAPAFSVAFGLAVDALIHLALALVRKKEFAPKERLLGAVQEQGIGILGSSSVICVGFAVFFASDFPPTVKFGTIIMVGALLAAILSLCLFPMLVSLGHWFRPKIQ
jgi:uncharacterized protein